MNAILIPAYKPDMKLVELTNRLLTHDDLRLVVVDDGSTEAFAPVFQALDPRVRLISYPVNKGKGGALKTGIREIYEHMPECERLVTADADGQHSYEDIRKIIDKSVSLPGSLVLGSRAFDGAVPARSRFGNFMTRQIFSIASGVRVRDTQTGLRGFDRKGMALFMDVPGDRYEYEINVLLTAAREGMPIVEETIRTIYLEENQSSHFHPLKDSLRIYMCIFKFACSSFLSFLVDYGLAALLSPLIGLIWGNTLARFISAVVNFTLNKRVVFKGNEKTLPAVVKYTALALVILALDNCILKYLCDVALWPWWIAKIVTETVLFLLNFPIQGLFVYRKQKRG